MSARVHVDRSDELRLFGEMLNGVGTAHILLIKAESGMGKTSLLEEFWDAAAGLRRVFVDLRPGTHTPEGVLGELTALDPDGFRGFFAQRQALAAPTSIQVVENKIIKSRVDFQLASADPGQLELRRQVLTESFFADMAGANPAGRATVAILDTFENGSAQVRGWLSALFLNLARARRWLVVVIAGQEIPSLGIGWGDLCIQQTLRPLDREHVSDWARRVQLSLSPEEIALLYDTTDGIPLDLKTRLGKLVLKRGASHD